MKNKIAKKKEKSYPDIVITIWLKKIPQVTGKYVLLPGVKIPSIYLIFKSIQWEKLWSRRNATWILVSTMIWTSLLLDHSISTLFASYIKQQ